MATITGELFAVAARLEWSHSTNGVSVVAIVEGAVVASSTVDADDRFVLEIPNDLQTEIEIRVGVPDAAPALVKATGNDIHVQVLYNPSVTG